METTPDDASENGWPPEIIARVKRGRAARQTVRQQYTELFASVSAAMFHHDPIGINLGDNADEYDAEAGTVIPRLRECSSTEDVATVLLEEFARWFGSDIAGDQTQYLLLASEIWKLWKENNL